VHPHSAPPRAAGQPVNPFELNRRVLASDLSLAAKAVLLVILDHARHGASRCTASGRTIAREAGVTERHVSSVVADLEARGLIRTERATGSVHSRRTITLGPCMHQVGTPFRLRLHEVGTDFGAGRKSGVHEVGTRFDVRSQEEREEKDGFLPLDGEEPSPAMRRFFGRFLAHGVPPA
jgi:hypothetical protein